MSLLLLQALEVTFVFLSVGGCIVASLFCFFTHSMSEQETSFKYLFNSLSLTGSNTIQS